MICRLLICTCLITASMVLMCAPVFAQASILVSDKKSGISLYVHGVQGKDFDVEYWYHDHDMDDRCTISIKDDVNFSLRHNASNTWQSATVGPFEQIGIKGRDGSEHSGDEGIIRYKIDRDQQILKTWSLINNRIDNLLPAYETPLSFSSLRYSPKEPVLGAIGRTKGVNSGTELFYRGMRDGFGDEWHTLTVADDDRIFQNNYYTSKWSSDGKVFYFKVNPKTPCIGFEKNNLNSEFYTTPAKTYFLPSIHEQRTYISGDVSIRLTNLTNSHSMEYRWNEGKWNTYTNTLSTNKLIKGVHRLSYRVKGKKPANRVIVYNPEHPSSQERHDGVLLWGDNKDALQQLKVRLEREPYKSQYQNLKYSWTQHKEIDGLDKGSRNWVTSALSNAIVARIEGVKTDLGSKYAKYTKQLLLDNKLLIDPVGFELSHNFSPMPTAEWNAHGYYSVNEIFDLAYAYDLIIHEYNSKRHPQGITPIEDLKIRDTLARWVVVNLQELRGYEGGSKSDREVEAAKSTGMWDCARNIGSLIVAMAMPSYNTQYYGCSGYNGAAASEVDLHFAGTKVTWKEALTNYSLPLNKSPSMRRRFDQLNGGLFTETGIFRDRAPYYDYPLMGHCFLKLVISSKNFNGHRYPLLEKSFRHAVNGTMRGLKFSNHSDKNSMYFPQVLLVNSLFPELSVDVGERIKYHTQRHEMGEKNDYNLNYLLYQSRPYGLVWYHDDIIKK